MVVTSNNILYGPSRKHDNRYLKRFRICTENASTAGLSVVRSDISLLSSRYIVTVDLDKPITVYKKPDSHHRRSLHHVKTVAEDEGRHGEPSLLSSTLSGQFQLNHISVYYSLMAAQRYIIRSESYAQTVPAFARRTVDYELSDDQELASSQPVSLIQLCRKSSSRNRATRKTKALHSASADDLTEASRGISAHDDVDRHEHFPRLSLPGYSSPAEYGSDEESEKLTLPSSRLVSQGYPWQRDESHTEATQEQTWHPSLGDYHSQKNPLNYATSNNRFHSGETSYLSESPFLRKSEWDSSERGTGPADSASAARPFPLETPQPYHYSQKAPQKEHLPASLQIYRESFDRPHDRSPYESYRLNRRSNRTDLPEVTTSLQYGNPHDLAYEKTMGNITIRSAPNFATHARSRLSNSEAATHSIATRKVHNSQEALAPGSRLSSGTSTSQRTLKEEIYAILDNMHVNSQTDPDLASTQIRESTQSPPARALGVPQLLKAEAPGLRSYLTSGDTRAEQRAITIRAFDIRKEPHRCQKAIPADTSPSEYGQSNIESALETPNTSDASPKIIKPPPGLPKPKISAWDKMSASTAARLRDAGCWFHQDVRGEEQLRQHIANTVEKCVDRTECLGGQTYLRQDRILTKQTISALGDVIANLHAYNSGEDQRGYFANFASVASRFCDLPVSGQRSYFEDPWERLMEQIIRDGEFT
ncbi:hypothetical protein BDV11DRAFT_204812 [Aspergillus similis]